MIAMMLTGACRVDSPEVDATRPRVVGRSTAEPAHAAVDTALQGTVDSLATSRTALVVVRVRDGALVALAGGADPGGNKVASGRRANLASDVGLRPGSLLKPFLFVAALDAKLLDESETFPERLAFGPPGGAPIRNADGAVCPAGTWQQALAMSCNTVAAEVAHRLGSERLGAQYMRLAGLANAGVREGTGPPANAPVPASPDGVTQAALGAGGVRFSPLQIAVLYAGLARGDPVLGSSAALGAVVEGLVGAANTGTAKAVTGLNVAAKTGTSEIPGTTDGWIAGYWPVDAPRLAFVVLVLGRAGHPVSGGDEPAAIAAHLVASPPFQHG